MSEPLDSLQTQLRADPGNWDVRLQIADQLLAQGQTDAAGVMISMAPSEPEQADHCSRAASFLLRVSPDRALRQAQRALAANEMDANAALVCAEVFRSKNKHAEAEKHFLVASQLDPERVAAHAELKEWIEAHAAEPPEEDSAPVVLQVLDRSSTGSVKPVTATVTAKAAIPPPAAVAVAEDDEEFVSEEGIHFHVSSDPHVHAKPSQLKTLQAKLAAAGVGILVHIILVLLLGVLVIVMPNPPSAEITAMTNVEDTQEKPESKKVVVPQPSPATAAVARPTTSAITATGISAVSLPEFDFQAPAEAVTEVATTDLGSTFSPAFAAKGMVEVNFFGIKSKGKRIAFLIEAERLMLTDPAYEIVKEEIANMISKFGVQTTFNVILFDGSQLSAFSEKPVPGTTANMAAIRDWFYPVNREYEKLGLRAINYPSMKPTREIEPIPTNKLTGYMLAIQYALESECDTAFIMTSGWRHMRKYDTPEEMEKYYKQVRWTDRNEKEWQEAVVKAQAWLKKENEARKEKGIPQRVIRGIHEIVAEVSPNVRRKPGPDIDAEEREDQINNAMRVIYSSQKKPKPQINFVMFIGKDERTVPRLEHFENISRRARNGKVRILQGLKNVTGRS